jgi:hypothetical protein
MEKCSFALPESAWDVNFAHVSFLLHKRRRGAVVITVSLEVRQQFAGYEGYILW